MRHTRQYSGAFVLLLGFLLFFLNEVFGQNRSKVTSQLIAPLPELLVSSSGSTIKSSDQWEDVRRNEILELFKDHVYGRVPESEISRGFSIGFEVIYYRGDALGNSAIQKEVEVEVRNGEETHNFTILIFLPKDNQGPVPMFLGLNFNGNHTIHSEKQISITDCWVRNNADLGINNHKALERSRGASSHRWPVEKILERGYGLATIYAGEIDPDFDDGFKNGIHRLFGENMEKDDPGSWGTIATWAWGLSRAMDYFETDGDVDHHRVAVIGHSRLGKTSLWAGAQDERFAMVVSNNSGCGGAALSRRTIGERVSRINTSFPHWFADRFNAYNDNEVALPVDQHMLMSLMAPRPLYVASAREDEWADPYGEYLSLYFGSKVYGLYGKEILINDQLPEVDQPRLAGNLGYHIRTGKHGITLYDWEQYLSFADKHMGPGVTTEFDNPVSMEWLSENISKTTPRLILTPDLESAIRANLRAGDAQTTMGLQLLHLAAESVVGSEPLVYKKTGRRLLGVSREAVRRLTTLALVYRFEQEEKYLRKLESELQAVCSFDDWNPSHFLDVAEMAAGIALALDWAGEWLSAEIKQMARQSIVEKALKPGIAASENNWWVNAHHNWNLVCNGGLSLAALAVFGDEPELASGILRQAVEKIPLALEPYAPDGIYPEGPSYWFYATTYLTVAISAYESALDTDFGFTDAPGVMESAAFSMVTAGPSGNYYNYFDASLIGYQSLAHFGLLSWFASRSDIRVDRRSYRALLENEIADPDDINGTRFFATHFLNSSMPDQAIEGVYTNPEIWTGAGEEPIAILRDREYDKDAFFLAAKGGRAADNHGNMDAGSFIFELVGVRWSVDPGNQNYHELEQLMGVALWDSSQGSRRWTLLTKNNFGHSTLTINHAMHQVDARATFVREDHRKESPEITFDLTPLYGDNIEKAVRVYSRPAKNALRINDHFLFSPATESITWQMMTRAEVTISGDRILLRQEGKELNLRILSGGPFNAEVISLSPPPQTYDKDIRGLKRIEIKLDRKDFKGSSGQLIVELSIPEKTEK